MIDDRISREKRQKKKKYMKQNKANEGRRKKLLYAGQNERRTKGTNHMNGC